jgi:UDPglucose--hexose-1-phosphate uridylyltransferase
LEDAFSVRYGSASGSDGRRRLFGVSFSHRISPAASQAESFKYLAGPEIGGGNFLSDTSPEEKAAELKAQSEVHYKIDPKRRH